MGQIVIPPKSSRIKAEKMAFIRIYDKVHLPIMHPVMTYDILAEVYKEVHGHTPFKDWNAFLSSRNYYYRVGILCFTKKL